MADNSVSSEYAMAELSARQLRTAREYPRAFEIAGTAANLALSAGDMRSWWAMVFLQGECRRDAARFEECAGIAKRLSSHPVATTNPHLAAKATILLALALQGTGRLREAVATASRATQLAARSSSGVELKIEAQLALLSALAESGQLESAWSAADDLERLLTPFVDDQAAGKAFWAIGNVAFICGKKDEGRRLHALASRRLSPGKDLELWAHFNTGSAAMRLAAGIADEETRAYIQRAELATDIVGGSERDGLELTVVLANWYFLNDSMEEAIRLLRQVTERAGVLAGQTAGRAAFLLGRCLLAAGSIDEGTERLGEAMNLFLAAGASDRADDVAEYLPGSRSA